MMGSLILSVTIGSIVAGCALLGGWSLLGALALYSGVGSVCVLMLELAATLPVPGKKAGSAEILLLGCA